MRPAARMPKLTRRSRILIAVAVAAVLLLLIGPRFIDAYVDWLWFGELGYRSVFTTVLVTRIVVFLVVSLLIGAVVFAGLALAYRTRPVFVPTGGPNDPVARYRTAVMSRLRLVGIGVPAFIGFFAGVIAQSYWEPIQLFIHGGELRGHRPAVRQGSRVLRVRPAVLPAGAHVPVRGDVPRVHRQPAGPLPVRRHPAVRARRCADPVGAHPADHAGRRPDAAEGTRVLVGPLRAAEPHPQWQAVHRRRLHRHQRRVAGQADPDGDRGDLRGGGVLRDCVARLADSSDRCSAAVVVVAGRRRRLALGRRADQRQTQCGAKGKRIHQPKYHRDQTGLRPYRQRGHVPRLQRQCPGDRPAGSRRSGDHVQYPVARPEHRQSGVHPVPAGQELLLLSRPAVHRPLPRRGRQPA